MVKVIWFGCTKTIVKRANFLQSFRTGKNHIVGLGTSPQRGSCPQIHRATHPTDITRVRGGGHTVAPPAEPRCGGDIVLEGSGMRYSGTVASDMMLGNVLVWLV